MKESAENKVSAVMAIAIELSQDIENEENPFKKTQKELRFSRLIRKYHLSFDEIENYSEMQENESIGHQSKYEQLKEAAIKLRKAQDALVKCKDRGVRSQIAQDVVKLQNSFDKMIGLKS